MAPQPFDYQNQGIAFLAPKDAALFGDDAGLGKSLQLIRAANDAGHERLLVLCPAIGRVSWRLQFKEWDTSSRPVHLYPQETAGLIPDGPVALIITYNWLSQTGNPAMLERMLAAAQPFDAAFLDEAQDLRNRKANRTKAVYGRRLDRATGILRGVPVVWPASATFTPKHAGELYPHLRALFPDLLRGLFGGAIPSPTAFEDRFCDKRHTSFGVKIEGNNKHTIPQLRDALRPVFMARRKADVLKDLPPINCVALPLEIGDKLERDAAVDAFFAELEEITDLDEATAMLGRALADPQIAARRAALGQVKTEPALEWALDFLRNTDRKLVIFAHHRDVIKRLVEGLRQGSNCGVVEIHGGTNQAAREAAVSNFQNDPSVRVCVGQTIAASTSITLTAASDVLLVEPDWTPVNNYQAISRCHRIGQSQGVAAYFAYAHGTNDDLIAKTLRRRAQDMADLYGAAPQGFTA